MVMSTTSQRVVNDEVNKDLYQIASSQDKTNNTILNPYGTNESGKIFDTSSPEVQGMKTSYPGLTDEAAIGNVLMQEKKAARVPAPSVITSKKAEKKTAENIAKLDDITKRQTEAAQTTSENATPQQAEDYNPTQAEIETNPILNQLNKMQASSDEYTNELLRTISEQFAQRKQQAELQQKATLGGLAVMGHRSGRSRYASELQSGIISAQERAGVALLAELDSQERMALIQAKMAKDAKDFELLERTMQEREKIYNKKRQAVLDLYQKQMDNEKMAMQKQQFEMQKQEYEAKQRNNELTNFNEMVSAGIDFNQLDSAEIADISFKTGYSVDLLKQIYETNQESQKAQSQKDEIELQKSIVDILSKVPENAEIVIGDETYSGLKELKPDTRTYTSTNNAGLVTYTTIDAKTGESVNTFTLSGAGKARVVSGVSKGSSSGVSVGSSSNNSSEGILIVGEPLSYDEWLYKIGEELGMSLIGELQTNKDEYDKYLQEFTRSENVYDEIDIATLKKSLTPTDKKRMVADGLDIENPQDIYNFITLNYKPKPIEEKESNDPWAWLNE